MNKSNDILKEIGRRDGMTVPENYFADFTDRMIAALPELQHDNASSEKRTLWLKIRPYAYMAAMFAGIFCMMELFSMIKNPSADLNIENFPALTATLQNENSEFEMIYEIDEYDILDDMYNEGYTPDEIYVNDDSVIQASY